VEELLVYGAGILEVVPVYEAGDSVLLLGFPIQQVTNEGTAYESCSQTFQDGFLTFSIVGIHISNGTQFLPKGMNEPFGDFIHRHHSS
jgi:hypothetical protein